MSIIPAPPTPAAGRLWWAGWYLQSVANFWAALGKAISGILIIGPVLSTPFKSVAVLFNVVAQYLYLADDDVQYWVGWIDALVNGTAFKSILKTLSPAFGEIIKDVGNWFEKLIVKYFPSGDILLFDVKLWMLHQFSKISIELYFFAYDPIAYIKAKIIYFIPQGDILLFSAKYWFLYRLAEISPQLEFFAYDPVAYIKAKIIYFIPQGDLLLFNPAYWVSYRLMEISPQLGFFAYDPIAYIKARILSELNFPKEFLESPIDFLIEKGMKRMDELWEVYADRIEKLVVNLILYFM